MKKLVFYIPILLAIPNLSAQVGINTNNPQTDLDINGSLLVTEEFQIGNLNTVNFSDENFKVITRRADSQPAGELTILDVNQVKVAPINIVDYEFTNLRRDDIDVNLQYDASKYIVALSNFQHIGGPILKLNNNDSNIGNFIAQTYIKDGIWHLEIGNRSLSGTRNVSPISYKVSLVIYDKTYFKQLPDLRVNLRGNNSGAAPASPL